MQPIIVPDGTPLWGKIIIAAIVVACLVLSAYAYFRDRRR